MRVFKRLMRLVFGSVPSSVEGFEAACYFNPTATIFRLRNAI